MGKKAGKPEPAASAHGQDRRQEQRQQLPVCMAGFNRTYQHGQGRTLQDQQGNPPNQKLRRQNLTFGQRQEAQDRLSAGTPAKEVAALFGISRRQLSRIKNRDLSGTTNPNSRRILKEPKEGSSSPQSRLVGTRASGSGGTGDLDQQGAVAATDMMNGASVPVTQPVEVFFDFNTEAFGAATPSSFSEQVWGTEHDDVTDEEIHSVPIHSTGSPVRGDLFVLRTGPSDGIGGDVNETWIAAAFSERRPVYVLLNHEKLQSRPIPIQLNADSVAASAHNALAGQFIWRRCESFCRVDAFDVAGILEGKVASLCWMILPVKWKLDELQREPCGWCERGRQNNVIDARCRCSALATFWKDISDHFQHLDKGAQNFVPTHKEREEYVDADRACKFVAYLAASLLYLIQFAENGVQQQNIQADRSQQAIKQLLEERLLLAVTVLKELIRTQGFVGDSPKKLRAQPEEAFLPDGDYGGLVVAGSVSKCEPCDKLSDEDSTLDVEDDSLSTHTEEEQIPGKPSQVCVRTRLFTWPSRLFTGTTCWKRRSAKRVKCWQSKPRLASCATILTRLFSGTSCWRRGDQSTDLTETSMSRPNSVPEDSPAGGNFNPPTVSIIPERTSSSLGVKGCLWKAFGSCSPLSHTLSKIRSSPPHTCRRCSWWDWVVLSLGVLVCLLAGTLTIVFFATRYEHSIVVISLSAAACVLWAWVYNRSCLQQDGLEREGQEGLWVEGGPPPDVVSATLVIPTDNRDPATTMVNVMV